MCRSSGACCDIRDRRSSRREERRREDLGVASSCDIVVRKSKPIRSVPSCLVNYEEEERFKRRREIEVKNF